MKIPSPTTIKVFEKCVWARRCRPDILWATYYQARQLLDQDIPGDFVECGVFAGTHPAMMARAIIDHGKPYLGCRRKVHLFDSFEGVPEPGGNDKELITRPATMKQLTHQTTCSLDQTKIYMEQWGIPDDLLIYHVGLLEETTVDLDFPIALLRIDCDLYSGTQAALANLFKLVVEGGICVLDDYSWAGPRVAFLETIPPQIISPIMWHRR